MPVTLKTVLLLLASNLFMTFAWYGHLRNMSGRAWYLAALASWSIALFEYLLQVPANRIGSQVMTVSQLKIIQEVISLSVFLVFAVLYLKETIKWNYIVSFGLIGLAVFFAFKKF